MKFLTLPVLALIALVSISGCSNSNDPTPIDNTPVAQVKSVTADGSPFATFLYGGQGQLLSTAFAGNGSISGGNPGVKYAYDATGRLIKAVSEVDSTQYTYTIEGRLQQSDTFTEWKLNKDGSGMDFRKTFSYGNNGQVLSMAASDGTKSSGQTQRYIVTYDYSIDGTLASFTYKTGDNPGQKFVIEDGYTSDVRVSPLILQRLTSLDRYLGLAGMVQFTGRFPKAIRYYENGKVTEGYTFNFDITDKKVNKLSAITKIQDNESTTNYQFQY